MDHRPPPPAGPRPPMTPDPLDELDEIGASGDARLSEPPDAAQQPRLPFPVVGLGASAGGLEAYTAFLDATPADTGMAFVLVQHLPPDRESLVAEILSRHTAMPVSQVEDGQAVEPDHVYVIRPGHTLTVRDGRLHLGPPLAARGHGRPVDDFFRSLAEEQQQRAVAVILSGMGSNGTAGAEAVKAVGGLVVAQDPESAKYPSMPRSVVDANLADFILRPAEIPDALVRYARHPYVAAEVAAELLAQRDRQAFGEILAVLRARTRHDFAGYRRATLLRRIQRRMGLTRVDTIGEYAKVLRQTAAEVSALADDLLIHVTGFFRDPEAWEALRAKVIEPLADERPDGGPVRAWVSACATGEEAYTLAMLLLEAAEARAKRFDIKVFATDMAERALGQARAGVFPGGIESEVSPGRLERFFDRDDAFYRVKKELREAVIFAPQNVLQDPPFSRLDIATCRNLLIYLEPDTQQRVLALLHFGLREGGALLLGNSESVGAAEGGDFEPIDKKHRLYRRVGPTRHGALDLPLPYLKPADGPRAPDPARLFVRPPVAQAAHRLLLEHFSPAAVVADGQGQIVYFHGDTGRYLDQPRGEPTRDILILANDQVRGAVRTALQRAVGKDAPVIVRDGLIDTPDGRRRVEVSVVPLDRRPEPPHYLVVFTDYPEAPPPAPLDPDAPSDARLADELVRVREELQGALEEMQTSNEELKASHEEVTSVNEELQSTNEELETSKEELQSLNEELTTVNAQLQAKMAELEASSNDIASLLASTDIAVLFLDPRFRIRRYTPATKDLFDLIPSDAGRPLADLRRKFADPDLSADAEQVLDKLIPVEREVASESGKAYLRRVLPYRTLDNRIDGVVVAFVDVTERKAAERALAEEKEYAEKIVETLHEPLLVLHPDLTVRSVNQAFYTVFRGDPARTVGRKVYQLGNGQWDIPALRTLLEDVLPDSNVFDDYEVRHDFEDIGPRVMLVNARRLDHVQLILLGIRDITERKRAEAALRDSEERFRVMADHTPALIWVNGPAGCEYVNRGYREFLGVDPEDVRGYEWARHVHPDDRERYLAEYRRAVDAGARFESEFRFRRRDGEYRWMRSVGVPRGLPGEAGVCVGVTLDVTDRRRAEDAVRESEGRLRAVAENLPSAAVFVVDHDLRFVLAEGEALREAGFTPAGLEGRTVAEAMPPELAPSYTERYRRALGGEPFRAEHDAHGRHYVSHGRPLRDAAGAVTAALAVSYDITPRVEAERSLRASEERFRLLVENARDHAIFGLSPEGVVTTWNEGAERVFGYAADEIVGRTGDVFFTPDDRAAGLPERERATAAAEGKAGDDNWAVRKDGSRFWASGASSAVRDEAGRLTGFAKVVRDRTEARAAEEAIRRAEEQLRQALAAARMGLWWWDVPTDTHTRDANLNRMLGLPPARTRQSLAEFLGRVHPDERAAVRAAFDRAVREGRELATEFRVVWPDGTVRWLRDQGDVFGQPDDGTLHMSGAVMDVTERKEAEEALRQARDELEARVAGRTAELQVAYAALEEQFAQRREMARRMSTASEQQRERISRELHDEMGQLLAGLGLGLKALEGKSTDPDAVRRLQALADRIGREAHRIALELRPTALDDLGLAAALRNYAEEWAGRTGVAVDLRLPDAADRFPPEVETAAYRIVQEALTNVVKHAAATRVSVVVERRPGQLTAIVEDDGRGFEPDALGEPRRPGDPLGLAGMRERAALVGGSVEVESSPGKGTTVYARLPLPADGG
ncbi:MAG: hypothetical protein C0501_18140 [Isosphaera sp.]|nr:hypothetical protein [Isosphaera sp.]